LQPVSGPPVDATGLMCAHTSLDLVVESNTGVDYAALTFGRCTNTTLGIDPPPVPLPTVVALRTAPNPFVRQARVTFELPRDATVRLAVFDISGRRAQTLYQGSASAGVHHLDWNARSSSGGQLQAGVYFLRLEADGRTIVRKVLMAR